MVQHGKEIYKMLKDWAVVDGAALFGSGLMKGRRSKVVSGGSGPLGGRWICGGQWIWIGLSFIFSDLGCIILSRIFLRKEYQNSNR
jgi:hypothetical protein